MTAVTPAQANAMGALIAAMNAAENATPVRSAPTMVEGAESFARAPEGVAIRNPAPMSNDIAAMAKIMAAFSSVADDVVERADTGHYPELSKALVTEATEKGARVGSWEIEGRTVDGFGKFYEVLHVTTGEPIASDLRLYEAALALVNALNDGYPITTSRVKSILAIEEEYARNLSDAVGYASRMKVTEGAQHDIAEARYSEAKRRALTAKKNLTSFTRL